MIIKLKSALQNLRLSASGNKAELIARVMEMDPDSKSTRNRATPREMTGPF